MQLALWPLSELQDNFTLSTACFANGNCALVESADLLNRILLKGGEELISIQYDGTPHYQNTTQYTHKIRNYQLQITTLNVESL